MSMPRKKISELPDLDSFIFDEMLKRMVEKKMDAKVPEPVKKKNTGKLMWRNKETVSRDTHVEHSGDLVTEITYKVPVEFEKENPGPIQMSKIITAVESLLDSAYRNFLNINKCKMVYEKEKYFVVLSAIYTDHGPMRKDKE